MESASSRVIRFGVFEVDLAARELRKRGVRFKLQDQPFRVLEALLEHPGEIVTREQLKDRLWADDEFVEFDKSLNTSVQKIRQALGDSAESPRFLETVPRQGYRFVAPVEVGASPGAQAEVDDVVPETTGSSSNWRMALMWALAGAVLGGFLVWTAGERGSTGAHRRYVLAPEAAGAGLNQERRHTAAISPDGAKIVYLSDEQPPQLWLLRFDGDSSEALQGTDDAEGVFWAPNSQTVAFSAEGAVKKVSIAGGSATTICALPSLSTSFGGGAWSRDGETIVFSAGTGGGMSLYTVPASGGQPELRLGSATGNVLRPRFLPGDSYLLIGDFNSAAPGLQDTHILDLGTRERSLLVEDARDAYYSPSGHVLYQREGALWALPFSVDKVESAGPAFRIGEGLVAPTVSEDGTLVSISLGVAPNRMQLTLRDRRGNRLRSIGPPLLNAIHPAVSPDGRRVAVSASDRRGAANDVWIYETNRSGEMRLTSDPRHEDEPVWTPDGRRILFRMQVGSDRNADFFIVDSDGSGEVQPFIRSDDREAEPDWSPDGGTLVYQVRSSTGAGAFDLNFLTVGRDGRPTAPKPFLKTEFNEVHAQFSPDGKYVAYVSSASGEAGPYVCPFPACTPIYQVASQGRNNAPRWSPDGRELYWQGQNGLMVADVDMSRERPITNVRDLFDVPIVHRYTFNYDVTPDGQFVIVEPTTEGDGAMPRSFIHVTQNWYEEFRDRERN